MALWNGRFSKKINAQANDFNSSLAFDKRLLNEDITGSIAHVTMLGDCEIIPKDEAKAIAKELAKMIDEELVFDDSEDIHSFIENELTKRLGDLGRKLHTARSRNDQVALDLRMYLKKEIDYIGGQIKDLINVLCDLAEQNEDSVMPGFTHLQHAQPITFAHHLMAYSQMFMRDLGRLKDCFNRMNESPLGSGALAGTTHPIDRHKTAEMLGFNKPCENSLDGVSDRDYCVELAGAISLIMVHLSRFCEEIILWASQEYKYIELDDGFATGSSIMPQKKNPDIAELIRGKCGRVFGDNTALLTMLKGLPLAYNKDMQEDKEAIFDSVDTVKMCLSTFAPMLATMRVNKENMRKSCEKGFINATDCADYLAKKGVPFRKAYEATGKIVAYCIENGKVLDDLSIEEYREFSTVFDNDVYAAISLEACVRQRNSYGGANTAAAQIAKVRGELIGN
ncbi:MAG: argininosuccinate lyase [Clostridiales bacterium]|nr:argininosuccinate lyase [Clostridiales bacterium]